MEFEKTYEVKMDFHGLAYVVRAFSLFGVVEYRFYNPSRILIGNKLIMIAWVLDVPKRRRASGKLPFPRFCNISGVYFLRHISRIHLIHHRPEERHIVKTFLIGRGS
jgi:hypothetical protein